MVLFPKRIDFFENFEKALDNLSNASERFVYMLENFGELNHIAKEIEDLEHEGDILTHDIMRQLNSTFLTPIDREDIHALASRVDDVLDLIWGCADRMVVFKFEKPTDQALDIATDLHRITEMMKKAFRDLQKKNYNHVQEHCIEINRLENGIDRTFRDALGSLFIDFKDDPLMVIKWKEIYEHLEDAADKCEDVANILEGIMLKHA